MAQTRHLNVVAGTRKASFRTVFREFNIINSQIPKISQCVTFVYLQCLPLEGHLGLVELVASVETSVSH